MDKVYLIYAIFDDLEDQTSYSYVEEICASLNRAEIVCKELVDAKIADYTYDNFTASKEVNNDRSIVVHKFYNNEPIEDCTFVIKEWTVNK